MCVCVFCGFFNDTATTEIYTRSIVGSVRCVQETGSEYATSFFESKVEAEEFPFDFERYQACLMEAARFLHFVFDFDTHVQKETHYLLILQSYQKHLGPVIEKYAEKKKVTLKSNLDTVNRSINFLQGVWPLSKMVVREMSNSSDSKQILLRSLGRLLISCCMTLHKNVNLDVDDTILFMKAAAEGMVILDQLEPQGCFSEKALPWIPSLLVVQTIGLYINHSNPELQELALVLLYQLKVKSKSPKDMPEVIKEILGSVVLEKAPSESASQFQFTLFWGFGVLGFWLSLIHISEPTRPLYISYAVFCLKKKNTHINAEDAPMTGI
eukprot:TRINITY_DN37659_c0_g1_i1.p1 TRINITY_DN37659_c0_g1~~TRINITY_DN37659_c0_g1_i1.p1  ORF type:complete len:325 (-),score=53.65 TRINITY_DN37659_c0_g1_i1:16-990(-)